MNKRGFLRIIEAVIAVVMILAFILYVTYKIPSENIKTPPEVKDSMVNILNQISNDKDLRGCFLTKDVKGCSGEGADASVKKKCECDDLANSCPSGGAPFKEIIDTRISGYNYACEVCETSLSCTDIPTRIPDKSVYTESRIMAPTEQVTKEPRVVRLYFWEE